MAHGEGIFLNIFEIDEAQNRSASIVFYLDHQHASWPKHDTGGHDPHLDLRKLARHHLAQGGYLRFIFISKWKMQQQIHPTGDSKFLDTLGQCC